MTKTTEKFQFKTEVNQLLDLVIHSLYSHRDVFLRELISNASDAIDKVRIESLKNSDLLAEGEELKIKIIRDDKKGLLTISDNGIGMTKDQIIEHLGTIAKSGTKDFVEKMKANKENPELIGQFGVGFYAAFMVADKVTVESCSVDGQSTRWVSAGENGFEVEEGLRSVRGTDIVLHLSKDHLEYLEEYRIREIVKKYSDFVDYPIVMDIEREEAAKDAEGKELEGAKPKKVIKEEMLNSRKAIWTKAKTEVSDSEYKDFYKHISHDFAEPLETIHFSAEGTSEFKALLYIPAKAPFDIYSRESIKGIHLYIKRVFIMNDFTKILPEYLRFVRGVVDASDLPLNVSREVLQEEAQVEKIRKGVVKKVLGTLQQLKNKDIEKYKKFYKEFGTVLKEGLHYDFENKDKIMELLLYTTTKATERSFADYVQDMSKEQKSIYYLVAADLNTAKASPHLEAFAAKGYEVVFMTDHIDEWVAPSLPEYQKKSFVAVDSADIDLGDKQQQEKVKEDANKEYGDLVQFIKNELKDKVKDVSFSARMTDSASCLVNDPNGMTESMARMFKSMGQEVPVDKKILELNPSHPVLTALKQSFEQDKASTMVQDFVTVLYGQAVLADGGKLDNPAEFAKKINSIMLRAAQK